MIYVMSDLHGCYDKYISMINKIGLCSEDMLYMLGDVVDRGPNGIKILLDMCERENVVFLRGNHDYTAMRILRCLFNPVSLFDDNEQVPTIQQWALDGGSTTLDQFVKMSSEDKKKVLTFLWNSKTFAEIEVNGKKFFLAHTVPEKERMMDFDQCKLEDFILGEPDYELEYYKDKYIVTGHTPTNLIEEQSKGRIYQKNNHIAVDCGAVFGNPLGCICLDTFEEFYVE